MKNNRKAFHLNWSWHLKTSGVFVDTKWLQEINTWYLFNIIFLRFFWVCMIYFVLFFNCPTLSALPVSKERKTDRVAKLLTERNLRFLKERGKWPWSATIACGEGSLAVRKFLCYNRIFICLLRFLSWKVTYLDNLLFLIIHKNMVKLTDTALKK